MYTRPLPPFTIEDIDDQDRISFISTKCTGWPSKELLDAAAVEEPLSSSELLLLSPCPQHQGGLARCQTHKPKCSKVGSPACLVIAELHALALIRTYDAHAHTHARAHAPQEANATGS